MAASPPVQPLVELGFTALEADVYGFLLGESPVTGYRVAQALRKPAPNIYKALESLEAKGAVMVDDGGSRVCRPVPPEELLGHLERRFQEHRRRAAASLSEIAPMPDDRIWRLESPDQVLERARTMLGRCREVALVDAFPPPVEELRDDIEAAAARGVVVGVKAYRKIELAGARVILDAAGEGVIGRWPGQWVNVVTDGAEHLVAFFSADGREVLQAIWSSSLWLSWVYHSALSAELMLAALENELTREDVTVEELRERRRELDTLKGLEASGYQELARRSRRQPAPPESVSRKQRKRRRS